MKEQKPVPMYCQLMGVTMSKRDEGWLNSKQNELMSDLEKRYDDGDNNALLIALSNYIMWDKGVPKWLRESFHYAQADAHYDLKSWDTIFGVKSLKGKGKRGKSAEAEKRRRDLWKKVYFRIWELKSKKKYKTNTILYEKIADEFSITSIEVQRAYTKFNRILNYL